MLSSKVSALRGPIQCARQGHLLRLLPATKSLHPSRSYFRGLIPYFPSNPFRQLERQIRDMEQHFDRSFGFPRFQPSWWEDFIPLQEGEHPTFIESYRIKNPIVEENGVKKLKLEFDVRRFRPEEVKVSTNAKENLLTVQAKHEDANSKFEFHRKLTMPRGVIANELKCRFTSGGVLQIEAPVEITPEAEPVKDTDIPVKHE
ncbi:hypothetical protein AB6A40_008039 [Gnathostoma spinigerum]|uniref:SHSP domain-containing protein n=1 Tax=Gnathostoma spinigerum TaxID=75299 RepID=A0ABD6EYK2_9BILA